MITPLVHHVRQRADHLDVLLAVHDWSTLAFGGHSAKRDRRTLTHATDVGYDLATVLMVDGTNGDPLAPVSVSLSAQRRTHSTRADGDGKRPKPHVDQVLDAMAFVSGLHLSKPVVHVVDREADSVGHWRVWDAAGHWALVRADDRNVLVDGAETTLEKVAKELAAADKLQETGPVLYRGRPARQFVAEAAVVLHRPAKRRENGKQRSIAGEPIELRLVVAEVRDLNGRRCARWLLLSNVPTEHADASRIATWYYWRWRIESLHKTLKSGGYDLEDWLQQSGDRLLRKLLIAMTALTAVWDLEHRRDAETTAFKLHLMNLSGRQTHRKKPITTTGLLAGLWVLQQMAEYESRAGPSSKTMLGKHIATFANERHPKQDV